MVTLTNNINSWNTYLNVDMHAVCNDQFLVEQTFISPKSGSLRKFINTFLKT